MNADPQLFAKIMETQDSFGKQMTNQTKMLNVCHKICLENSIFFFDSFSFSSKFEIEKLGGIFEQKRKATGQLIDQLLEKTTTM